MPDLPVTSGTLPIGPQISVVIPAYDGAGMIRDAILSCVEQSTTECQVEVVVVDDASKDDSAAIAGQIHADVHVVRLPQNRGRHVARNTGLEVCRGEFVKFLDQDDVLEPGTLSQEYKLAIESQADIVIARSRILRDDGKGGWEFDSEVREVPDMEPRVQAVLKGNAVPTAAALYRRDYLKGLTWSGDVPRLDDWDWFVRAALRMGKIVPIDHVSYSWRHHSKQYTHRSTLYQYALDHHKILRTMEAWLRENNEFTSPNTQSLAQYYYKMLRVFFQNDVEYYRKALNHIYALDPNFFPHREARREVRWLCRIVGVRRGLWIYNRVADLRRRSWTRVPNRTADKRA